MLYTLFNDDYTIRVKAKITYIAKLNIQLRIMEKTYKDLFLDLLFLSRTTHKKIVTMAIKSNTLAVIPTIIQVEVELPVVLLSLTPGIPVK